MADLTTKQINLVLTIWHSKVVVTELSINHWSYVTKTKQLDWCCSVATATHHVILLYNFQLPDLKKRCHGKTRLK